MFGGPPLDSAHGALAMILVGPVIGFVLLGGGGLLVDYIDKRYWRHGNGSR
jgi:hypothetical protein